MAEIACLLTSTIRHRREHRGLFLGDRRGRVTGRISGRSVISATLWQVPDALRLRRPLRAAGRRDRPGPAQIPLHGRPSSPSGIPRFSTNRARDCSTWKRGLWAAMALLNMCPVTWREVWQLLCAGSHRPASGGPLVCGLRHAGAAGCRFERIAVVGRGLREACRRHGVRLAAIRSRAVFPDLFNRLVQQHGSKGNALSSITLDLAAQSWPPWRPDRSP